MPTPIDTCQSNAEHFGAFLPYCRRQPPCSDGSNPLVPEMPWKYHDRVRARKSVSRRFRTFVDALMKQFTTPPKQLLNRAEAKLNAAPPEADDKPVEPPVR